MDVRMRMCLPREEFSIPVCRHVCGQALRSLGAESDCVDDLEIALTEACTNVLKHVQTGDEYEVTVGFDEFHAVIEVIDVGRGFDSAAVTASGDSAMSTALRADSAVDEGVDLLEEHGRGIQLMRALVDRVQFDSKPEAGTIVHLEKALRWKPDAPVLRLMRSDQSVLAALPLP